jgi:hypothetical protein
MPTSPAPGPVNVVTGTYTPGYISVDETITGQLVVGATGAIVNGPLNVNGSTLHTINTFTTANLTVASATALGDNGVGEIQLANAITVPTTNPTGGAVLYATGGGTYTRDGAGSVWPVASPATNGGVVPGAITQTLPYTQASGAAQPTNGTLVIASCFISAGTSVGHVGFVVDTTAGASLTHWWAVVLDNGYKQQAHSADQLTAPIAASTWFTLPMVTPYVATYSGNFYLGVMIANSAGTQPNLTGGSTPRTVMITGTNAPVPLMSGPSTGGLTAPGTDNSTVYNAPTTASAVPFLYATA